MRMLRNLTRAAAVLLVAAAAACAPLPTESVWPNPSPPTPGDPQAVLDQLIAENAVDFDDGFCDLTNVRVAVENYVTDATLDANAAYTLLNDEVSQRVADRVRLRGQELIDATEVRRLFYELLHDLVYGPLASAAPAPSGSPSEPVVPPDEDAVLSAIEDMLAANEKYNRAVGEIGRDFTSADAFSENLTAITTSQEVTDALAAVDPAYDAITDYEDKRCWNRG